MMLWSRARVVCGDTSFLISSTPKPRVLEVPFLMWKWSEQIYTVGADGTFWAINYFFAGEDFLASDTDPIFAQYGIGASQTSERSRKRSTRSS